VIRPSVPAELRESIRDWPQGDGKENYRGR
jgi:hypothetical protein